MGVVVNKWGGGRVLTFLQIMQHYLHAKRRCIDVLNLFPHKKTSRFSQVGSLSYC